jgi:hypothetical protein
MYISLEEAKEEIWKRWNDVALKKRVEEYIGGSIPEVLMNEPRAVIFRNIISPSLEYLRFRELANKIGLEPLGFEYHEDRFCTRSTDKLTLANLRIFLRLPPLSLRHLQARHHDGRHDHDVSVDAGMRHTGKVL